MTKNNHFQMFLAFAKDQTDEAKIFQSCDCTPSASPRFQVSDNVQPHYRGLNQSELFLIFIVGRLSCLGFSVDKKKKVIPLPHA